MASQSSAQPTHWEAPTSHLSSTMTVTLIKQRLMCKQLYCVHKSVYPLKWPTHRRTARSILRMHLCWSWQWHHLRWICHKSTITQRTWFLQHCRPLMVLLKYWCMVKRDMRSEFKSIQRYWLLRISPLMMLLKPSTTLTRTPLWVF